MLKFVFISKMVYNSDTVRFPIKNTFKKNTVYVDNASFTQCLS